MKIKSLLTMLAAACLLMSANAFAYCKIHAVVGQAITPTDLHQLCFPNVEDTNKQIHANCSRLRGSCFPDGVTMSHDGIVSGTPAHGPQLPYEIQLKDGSGIGVPMTALIISVYTSNAD